MKRVSKLFAMLIAAVGTMVFSACDTSTDGENFYVSYGEVVGTSEAIHFISLKTCCQRFRWKMVCVYE